MPDWLTIDVALAALLVTSFTSIGLVALWAATSPRHWFVRIAVPLALLAPLLVIPAYEPFVTFVIQSLVIFIGALACRWQSSRPPIESTGAESNDAPGKSPIYFSLSSLLLATLIVAIAITVIVRLPKLNLQAWTTVVIDGVAAGFATLVAASMFATSNRRNALRIACTVLCMGMCITAAFFDCAAPSITEVFSNWPPEAIVSATILGIPDPTTPIIAWFIIPPLVALMTICLIVIWRRAVGTPAHRLVAPKDQSPSVPQTRLARGILLACLLAVSAFPLFTLEKLLSPDPLLNTTLPDPNAYDELIIVGNSLGATAFDGTLDIDTATPKQLSAEVQSSAKTYSLLSAALKKPCVVPVSYSESDLQTEEFMSFRRLARALCGKGKLAEAEKRLPDAAECYRQATQLGYSVRRGGLLIHALVGMACSGFGTRNLYRIRDDLPSDELDRCIALLVKLDSDDEPYDDVWYRDRVWAQQTYGWHGHLKQFLDELVDAKYDVFFISSDDYPYTYWTNQATVRLLICELAVARFHQATNRWPSSLDDVVPKFLSKIPIDPLDPTGRPLKYRPTESGYVLYSVGPNCVDDNRAAPNKDDMEGLPRTGDLRLDIHFKPDDTTGVTSQQPGADGNVPTDTDIPASE